MKIHEITEGAAVIWGRTGNKTVRKYRCTAGTRKGRIVSNPGTCSAPLNIARAVTLKKTKARRGATMKLLAKRTKKYNAASVRTARLNRARVASRKPPSRRTSYKRRRI